MERNISEMPIKWVILKIGGGTPHYRVFGGWPGGYLSGDSWKVNSGISKVESADEFYYFYGFSGSCYRCRKRSYGIIDGESSFGSYVGNILDNMINNSEGKIEVVEYMDDFMDLIK